MKRFKIGQKKEAKESPQHWEAIIVETAYIVTDKENPPDVREALLKAALDGWVAGQTYPAVGIAAFSGALDEVAPGVGRAVARFYRDAMPLDMALSVESVEDTPARALKAEYLIFALLLKSNS